MKKINFKENKTAIIIISVIVLYGIIMGIYFILKDPEDNKIKYNSYIMINSEDFYEVKDGSITSISLMDMKLDDVIFDVYSNYVYAGEYKVRQSDMEYQYIVFNNARGSGSYLPDIPYIAFTDDFRLIEFEKEEYSEADKDDLKSLLYTKGIDYLEELYESYKVNIDIDNDKEKETIYVATNYNYEEIPEQVFSIVYVMDDSQRRILEEYYYTEENIVSFIKPSLNYILDLNMDGNYTILVSSSDEDVTINNFYVKKGNFYTNIRLV